MEFKIIEAGSSGAMTRELKEASEQGWKVISMTTLGSEYIAYKKWYSALLSKGGDLVINIGDQQ